MVEQIDMFAMIADPSGLPPPVPVLNGFYYEAGRRKYVSFVLGRRHFETDGYGYPAEWKNRIKQERQI